jgi:hypothetical protein
LCVSTEASFGLAGVLVPAGGYCLKTAWQRDRSALPLAAVPLFFGIQQCSEGLVWVAIGHENSEWLKPAALFYLFCALVFWLFWIPFSAAFLESKRKIKFLLGLGAVLGLAGGLAFYLPILLHPEVLVVSVEHHSIRYDFTRSAAMKVISEIEWHVAYLVVVSLPLLLVARQRRGLIVLGTVLVASAAISHFYFWYAYTSVWCFLSAVLSVVFAYVFHKFPLATNRNFAAPPVAPVPKRTVHG